MQAFGAPSHSVKALRLDQMDQRLLKFLLSFDLPVEIRHIARQEQAAACLRAFSSGMRLSPGRDSRHDQIRRGRCFIARHLSGWGLLGNPPERPTGANMHAARM